MASIINLVQTTELEAVNSMLSAIGEAPISGDPAASTQADVAMALNILRNCTREVQSMGWRFNTEFGYELAAAGTLAWVGTDGSTATLNIFKPPVGLVTFTVSKIPEQQGSKAVDTIIRLSRKYVEATLPVLVFYDRAKNRDGFNQADRTHLYIDPVWLVDFEQMPEVARRFCTIRAARQFIQQVVGSRELAGFSAQDESLALRNLKREQGEDDDYNMLDNSDVSQHLGLRPRSLGVVSDRSPSRKTPGTV